MHLFIFIYLKMPVLFVKRKQAVQGMDVFRKVVTSIPGIDAHDANAVTRMPLEKFLHDAPFSCPATIIHVCFF